MPLPQTNSQPLQARGPFAPAARRMFATPFRLERRILFFVLVIATSWLSANMMYEILAPNSMTAVEWMILGLFVITFSWIVIAFWSGVAGFVLSLLKLDPMSLRRRLEARPGASLPRLTSLNAIVMPIYNEDPKRVLAGMEATFRSLRATGALDSFHFYILSDTRNEEIAAQEVAGWRALAERLGAQGRLFYRRREHNEARKAGNIADFCRRWGRRYDHMLVLDADSVMSGEAIVTLAATMEANPEAGIIQTVPLPVRQQSVFGRCVQFAARLYSPMLAGGLAFWQMGESNYWGHNAIIRVRAFAAHCGLPHLPGAAPLGGEILSHDFVEAALIRRGGWRVYLMADLPGSYEEMPGNILDYAKRDKRWAQGNLQHLKLVGARGLHGISRVHFIMGALAYASSLLWLLLLLLTTLDAILRAVVPHNFFGAGPQLFPDWQVVKHDEIISLFKMTIVMLFAPKVFGLGLALLDGTLSRRFGGRLKLVWSALIEHLFSMLLAPVMMCLHAYFVMTTLLGHVVAWDAQNRDATDLGLREVTPRLWVPPIVGCAWGLVTAILTPDLFSWLLPVILGMLVAIPLTVWSSRSDIGLRWRAHGIFLTPEESEPPAELAHLDEVLARPALLVMQPSQNEQMVPAEARADMYPQHLDYWGRAVMRWIAAPVSARRRAPDPAE